MNRRLVSVVVLLGQLLGVQALAGGGVMLANDRCVMTIGFYQAHFTAYQPESRGDEEFCEDLPDQGETVFVLDYLHDSLKEVPVDFRIIRDPTGLGRFVRLEDLAAVDLERHTVFYRPPTVEPSARLQVTHRFTEPGEYIGIVTAGHPSKAKTYTSVFPFAVGLAAFPWTWVLAGLGVAAAGAALAVLMLRERSGGPGRVSA